MPQFIGTQLCKWQPEHHTSAGSVVSGWMLCRWPVSVGVYLDLDASIFLSGLQSEPCSIVVAIVPVGLLSGSHGQGDHVLTSGSLS